MTNEKFNKNYDVFHAFLVEQAEYDGRIELPCIRTSSELPERMVPFSKAMSGSMQDHGQWVHFYEHDKNFERLWNNPRRYLSKLKKFKGIISPDFSLYRNMPLVMQEWNTYRGRALAVWLQNNGIEVLPNVRWNDERTFDFCFDGIEKHKTVAVGTLGCIKRTEDKAYFKNGLETLVQRLSPETIIVYGASPDAVFKKYRQAGIRILSFESEFSKSRKQVTA
jgi:hypothetical protein